MPESIRLWSVANGDTLHELNRQPVDLESRLEDWMHSDIRVLSEDLLVIARQHNTGGHGILDLLCIDRSGDLVVVELKRGRTPRDVVAQTLDYGAWVASLEADAVVNMGDESLGGEGALATAFAERFGDALPETLNDSHNLLIVSSALDDSSERIIRYLNDEHGVAINAVTFNYFRDADGRELLARTHLIEPEVAEVRAERRVGSKRRRKVSLDDHRRVAERLGLGDVFDALLDGLRGRLMPHSKITMVTCEDRQEKVATVNLVPGESNEMDGLRVNVYSQRLGQAFGVDPDAIRGMLPENAEPWSYAADAKDHTPGWDGYTCAFPDVASARRFIEAIGA